MEWKTTISTVSDGKELIRGYNLRDLIVQLDFVSTVFLVLRGELPNARERRMLDALFTAAIDHGIGVSSAMTARTVASTGNSMHAALAAGILAMGTLHGSAIEDAAKFFQMHVHERADVAVATARARNGRIPGYGHRILADDPRAHALFAVAKDVGFFGTHCTFASAVHDALNVGRATSIPLNVDGAMAAIIVDMGFDWHIAKGFFLIGRVPGLVAHIAEEMASGNGLRRLVENEASYIGPSARQLPTRA